MLQVVEENPVGELSPRAHEPVVRDETYYMQDGSCILQVENTLFNVSSVGCDLILVESHISIFAQVHRTLLCKDSSLFSTMFELPQGEHESDGGSDSSPILLCGETVSGFRNFLWVLYALYALTRLVARAFQH